MKSFLKAFLLTSVFVVAAEAAVEKMMLADSPEPAMRAVINALFAGDQKSLEKHTLPNPQTSLLVTKTPPTGDELKSLIEESAELKFRQVQSYRLDGRPVQDGPSGYPPGTTARFMATVNGVLTVFTVVKTADGWKVDLRWWIEMMEMAKRDSIPKGSPEMVVKSFVLALLRLNKNEARKYLTLETDLNKVFVAAPPYAEPSDQLPMLAVEMPLVEARPDESYPLPSGRIAKGSDKPAERKLLVGLFGSAEVVFELVKIKNEWKIVGQSYFRLLNQ